MTAMTLPRARAPQARPRCLQPVPPLADEAPGADSRTLVEVARSLALAHGRAAERRKDGDAAWRSAGRLKAAVALGALALVLAAPVFEDPSRSLLELLGLGAQGFHQGPLRFVLPACLVLLEAALASALLLSSRFRVPRSSGNDEVLQTVSHDLRAPLAATEGYIKYLMQCESGPLNPEQMELLNTALSNLNRLEHFINDMLDLAKIEAGRMVYRFEIADPGAVIEEAVALFRFFAQEKGVALSCSASVLPAVQMDVEKVRRILDNLLSNALKFTEEGGSVTVRARAGRDLEVSVSDTGIGIPEAAMDKLFHKYGQLEQAELFCRRTKGTGLGLWIVKGIVEGHGGKLWAESKAGVGSTFRFTLPLAQEDQA